MNLTNSIASHETLPLLKVLLVEDDDDDVLLTSKVLLDHACACSISRVEDGVQALEYLYGTGQYENSSRPDVILLDLNMPRMDGRQVLQRVKTDPNLQLIPVIVLTTSEDSRDIHRSYEDRANGYVTKPVNLSDYRRVLKALSAHWFQGVKLPTQV
ncbi:response regulator [Aeoliella mucimassa]|uniref:Response regulator rcp1 n=1 Tax=Aeoliella mucimassa TaxID=2527972 RepID=A0A518ARH4_9BACT|nr:response regulator [Aeoliella mucimassa]QDU57323.1 Response regulator rcp1 [Aeoliella mucimassa]